MSLAIAPSPSHLTTSASLVHSSPCASARKRATHCVRSGANARAAAWIRTRAPRQCMLRPTSRAATTPRGAYGLATHLGVARPRRAISQLRVVIGRDCPCHRHGHSAPMRRFAARQAQPSPSCRLARASAQASMPRRAPAGGGAHPLWRKVRRIVGAARLRSRPRPRNRRSAARRAPLGEPHAKLTHSRLDYNWDPNVRFVPF